MVKLKDFLKTIIDQNTEIRVLIRREYTNLRVNDINTDSFSYWFVYEGTVGSFYTGDIKSPYLCGSLYNINPIFNTVKDLEVVETSLESAIKVATLPYGFSFDKTNSAVTYPITLLQIIVKEPTEESK